MALADFSCIHRGSTIYVLGSGPSLDFVPVSFYDHQIVIATNRVAERLGLYQRPIQLYTHSHYHYEDVDELSGNWPDHHFFAPNGDQGHAGQPGDWAEGRRNVHFYPHPPTQFSFYPPNAQQEDGLIVGSTSIHGSMHLACWMGAKNLILVGADCGWIDGATNHTNYKSGNLKNSDEREWMARWNEHLIQVKHWLMTFYDVNIHSLNPFVNFNMEGHVWQGVTGD